MKTLEQTRPDRRRTERCGLGLLLLVAGFILTGCGGTSVPEEVGDAEPVLGTYNVTVKPNLLVIGPLDPDNLPEKNKWTFTVEGRCEVAGVPIPVVCENWDPQYRLRTGNVSHIYAGLSGTGANRELEVTLLLESLAELGSSDERSLTVGFVYHCIPVPTVLPPGFTARAVEQLSLMISVLPKTPELREKMPESPRLIANPAAAVFRNLVDQPIRILINNGGKSAATITSIWIEGPDSGLFQVGTVTNERVPPGFGVRLPVSQTTAVEDYALHTARVIVAYDNGAHLVVPITTKRIW